MTGQDGHPGLLTQNAARVWQEWMETDLLDRIDGRKQGLVTKEHTRHRELDTNGTNEREMDLHLRGGDGVALQ